ncbi:hypothetical protein [Trichothermofontia sp.]
MVRRQDDSLSVRQLLEQAQTLGQISRSEHRQLTSALLGDPSLSSEERCQINLLLDAVRMGRFKLGS